MYRSKPFQAPLTGRISHPCRQCRDVGGLGWTLKQEGCQYFEKPAQDLSFLCSSCYAPRPVSARAVKSLHSFLGQGRIKILQHYRRLLVAEWAAFSKHTERQDLPCRIAHMGFRDFWSFLTPCVIQTYIALKSRKELSQMSYCLATSSRFIAEHGFTAQVTKKVKAGFWRFIPFLP